jgi:hypothetical protein
MKNVPTQLDTRENIASSRRHASRPTVDSLPSMSKPRSRGLPFRQPTPVLASRASEPDESIITMRLGAATGGETGNTAEGFSARATVITATESRQVPTTPEPFVSSDEAAQFLCVKRRYLLELARRGIAGAYPIGTGGRRKIWVFRLSELAASVVGNETSIPKLRESCTIGSGSPR